MKVAFSAFDLIETMAREGNPNSVSDAGVGAIAIRGAIYGAYLNVRINASGLKDKTVAENLVNQAQSIFDNAIVREKTVTDIVIKTIAG
jgi:glutamate formiminotransferase/formiminotetrahydrofolate cyclodeaminase